MIAQINVTKLNVVKICNIIHIKFCLLKIYSSSFGSIWVFEDCNMETVKNILKIYPEFRENGIKWNYSATKIVGATWIN